jgi:hypothetical protein
MAPETEVVSPSGGLTTNTSAEPGCAGFLMDGRTAAPDGEPPVFRRFVSRARETGFDHSAPTEPRHVNTGRSGGGAP